MAAHDSCYAGYISSYMEKKIEELSDGNIVNQQLPSLPSQEGLSRIYIKELMEPPQGFLRDKEE